MIIEYSHIYEPKTVKDKMGPSRLVTSFISISEVLGSNLDQETGYAD
jgi:hypothetical protein